jgi:hypothetical protein
MVQDRSVKDRWVGAWALAALVAAAASVPDLDGASEGSAIFREVGISLAGVVVLEEAGMPHLNGEAGIMPLRTKSKP